MSEPQIAADQGRCGPRPHPGDLNEASGAGRLEAELHLGADLALIAAAVGEG